MRVKVFTVAILASLLMWAAVYYAMQGTYRTGQTHGVVPNLQLKQRIGL